MRAWIDGREQATRGAGRPGGAPEVLRGQGVGRVHRSIATARSSTRRLSGACGARGMTTPAPLRSRSAARRRASLGDRRRWAQRRARDPHRRPRAVPGRVQTICPLPTRAGASSSPPASMGSTTASRPMRGVELVGAVSPAAPASGARVGALGLVDLLPQRAKIQHEPRAARHAHATAPRGAGDRVSTVAAQLVNLEAA